MTTEEFSNEFDTLLSSYLHISTFGELNSLADVVFDEYEKSTLLTQAQDLIVKTYFDKTLNALGQGFDDSAIRLMDYANLISVKTFTEAKISSDDEAFSERGIVIDFGSVGEGTAFGSFKGTNGETYYNFPLFIINERVVAGGQYKYVYTELTTELINALLVNDEIYKQLEDESWEKVSTSDETALETAKALTEKLYTRKLGLFNATSYVIVPLNYLEYDRIMSKAYCEPLKRLAWRLFETDKSNLTSSSEIILRSDAGLFRKYVVRYIRKPRPIVLVDLTNTDNDLTIDGVLKRTECELNPIIHGEILTLAVQMALVSRGIQTNDTKAANSSSSSN